jgi:hypothetical protein
MNRDPAPEAHATLVVAIARYAPSIGFKQPRLCSGHAAGATCKGHCGSCGVCPVCAVALCELDEIAGALLDSLPPAPLAADALKRTLTRLDREPAVKDAR